MNIRTASRSGAFWRERFLAIGRQAQAAAPRPTAHAGVRIRPRLAGSAAPRRFDSASFRF